MVDEGLLHGVQRVALGQPFDRHHLAPLGLGGHRQAGDHAPAVHEAPHWP